MSEQITVPAILNDLNLDGCYNTMDIGSLAETLSWLRRNTKGYHDSWSVNLDQMCVTYPERMSTKMTRIHKYLSQLPVDTTAATIQHVHVLANPDIHITLNRLDETMFLVEINMCKDFQDKLGLI